MNSSSGNVDPPLYFKPTESLTPSVIKSTVDTCLRRANVRLRSDVFAGSLLSFRRAVSSDAATIVSLLRKISVYERNQSDGDISSVLVDEDACQQDGFGSHPRFHCLLLEEVDIATAKSKDKIYETPAAAATVRGMALWYVAYSTWTSPFLFLESLFVDEMLCNRTRWGDVEEHIMHAMVEIASSLECSRLVWQSLDWDEGARAFYSDVIGASTLEEVLTLKMDSEAMASFLDTLPQKNGDSEALLHQRAGSLSPNTIDQVIDKCLNRNNILFQQNQVSRRIRLRRAEKEDINSIMRLVRALAEYVKEPDAVEATTSIYLRDGFGENPLFHCILVEGSEQAGEGKCDNYDFRTCGIASWYLGFCSADGRLLYLEDLFIEPAHRGLGGGKRVMYALADIALSLNCGRFVWQTLQWMVDARSFYTNIGATTEGERLTHRLDQTGLSNFLLAKSIKGQNACDTLEDE